MSHFRRRLFRTTLAARFVILEKLPAFRGRGAGQKRLRKRDTRLRSFVVVASPGDALPQARRSESLRDGNKQHRSLFARSSAISFSAVSRWAGVV